MKTKISCKYIFVFSDKPFIEYGESAMCFPLYVIEILRSLYVSISRNLTMNDPSFLSRRSGQALTLPLFGEEYSTLIFSLPTELVILQEK